MARDIKTVLADIDSFVIDRFLQHLTDDVVFRFGNADPLVGKAAVREGVLGFWTTIAGLRHDLLAVYEDGDVVVGRIEVTYNRLDGKQVTVQNCDILTYEGDLVRDWQIYIDLAPVYA